MNTEIESIIKMHGHAVVATQVETPDGLLDMSFTVGLSRVGMPEVIVFALSAEVAQAILNTSAKKFMDGEVLMSVGIPEIVDPYDVVFKRADLNKVREVTQMLEALARVENPDIVQLVWPDRTGAFPWEATFDRALVTFQPCLFD